MDQISCRLLPFSVADGAHNMAADESLLGSAIAGVASLRFYGWSEATLSLGYFQRARARNTQPNLAALPFVRRPSGGGALVHHHEVTYALALPAGRPWQTGESWLCRMHEIIAGVLRSLGVFVRDCVGTGTAPSDRFLCFAKLTPGDLLIDSVKIVGSAQRRQRGALLQHGAILLAASPHAPVLPGIRELTGLSLSVEETCQTVAMEFARKTGWHLHSQQWTLAELDQTRELVHTKYSQESWNCKR